MEIIVRADYADGSTIPIAGDFADLVSAVGFALEAANDFGSAVGGGLAPPVSISVIEDDAVQLSIRVFPGGLAAH